MLAALLVLTATQDSTINLSTEPLCPGRIDRMQCGQFIEYLCNLVPGMWSEKLYDGNFEGLSPYKFDFIAQKDFKEQPWYPSGAVNRAEYSLDREQPVNGQTCQKIVAENGARSTVGISQDGIFVDPADPCKFSIWLRQQGLSGFVRFKLHDGAARLAEWSFRPEPTWKRFEIDVSPSARTKNATITIEFDGPGTLWLDAASMMPLKTVGGWRPDVVQALRDLNPGVIRIGGSVMDDPNLGDFQWSDTVGDPDRRKPFRAWGGLQPTGPGLAEFVDLCRAVNAEPLICVRFRERTPRDAANEVEYFNGATTTPMGLLRAKNGHPLPYKVRFWQVGNERAGPEYERALTEFCRAMRAVDPTIKLFSSFPTDGVLTSAGSMLDFVCPHHYDVEDLAGENADFASIRQMIARDAPGRPIKVAVTEWNTTAGDRGLKRARLWDLENALACSRYQNLMHRNCDLVEIADRSNLTNSFCSGIIQTDASQMYLTPTYYAQMLYSQMAGTQPLRIDPPAPLGPGLDVSATLSESGKELTLFIVNESVDSVPKRFDLSAFVPLQPLADIVTLEDRERAGEPDTTNNFDDPTRVAPVRSKLAVKSPQPEYRFPPLSLTVLRFRRA